MPRYRKRPLEVEAIQWDGSKEIADVLHTWSNEKAKLNFLKEDPSVMALFIDTPEGVMRADRGDWIIKGVKGEVYPCKPDVFDMTYETWPL